MIQGDDQTRNLLTLLEANIMGYYRQFAQLPDGGEHDEGDLRWGDSPFPYALCNGVTYADLTPATAPARIAPLIEHFRGRQHAFLWHIGPSSQPANLGELLLAAGLEHEEDEPGMACDLHHVSLVADEWPALDIIPVTNAEQLAQWMDVWTIGESPAASHAFTEVYRPLVIGSDRALNLFIGWKAGQPVGTVGIFYAAGIASVQYVVTLPSQRRQGIGRALTLFAMRQAQQHGVPWIVLTASPEGYGIYRQLGFHDYALFSTYRWSYAPDK